MKHIARFLWGLCILIVIMLMGGLLKAVIYIALYGPAWLQAVGIGLLAVFLCYVAGYFFLESRKSV